MKKRKGGPGGAVSDGVVIGAVGLGIGAWAYGRYKSGEGYDLNLPLLGGGASVPSIDLSGLLGGINIGDLGGGGEGLIDAIRTWFDSTAAGGKCPQGGGAPAVVEPGGPAAGGGGSEPSAPWDFTPRSDFFGGATGLVQAVGELSPVAQAFVGAGLGALGGGTAYLMVRTAPAVGRLAGAGVSALVAGGRTAGSVLSAGARSLVARWSASRATAAVAGVRAGQVRTVTRYVLPALGKQATRQTAGVIGAVAVLPFIAASVTTFIARAVEAATGGRYDPEQSVGWGALSSLSLVDFLMAPSDVGAAEVGAAYRAAGPFAGAFAAGGSARLPAASAAAQLGGMPFYGAAARGSSAGAAGGAVGAASARAVLGGLTSRYVAPSAAGASETIATREYRASSSRESSRESSRQSGTEASFQSPYSMV